jgi:hypothetical protein
MNKYLYKLLQLDGRPDEFSIKHCRFVSQTPQLDFLGKNLFKIITRSSSLASVNAFSILRGV